VRTPAKEVGDEEGRVYGIYNNLADNKLKLKFIF
jgi:hypothetical protein